VMARSAFVDRLGSILKPDAEGRDPEA
jgi:hypothetical protein